MIEPRSFGYQVDADTAVATITLNRPERLNALTFEVYRELSDTFAAFADEGDVRAVVITGTGRAFSTGGDVEQIIGPLLDRDAQGLLEFTRMTGELILNMLRCPKPIVGGLNGTVAGAGAVIATACDLRVAADTARIAFLFTKVGLSGADMGASWLLPRIVGLGRASELLLTGDFITAREALAMGLYNRVVAEEQVLAEAQETAAQLARGPRHALAVTKKMLLAEQTLELERAMAEEVEVQAKLMAEPDFRAAYQAFMEKRTPEFE